MEDKGIQDIQSRHQRGFQLTRKIKRYPGMAEGIPGLPGGFQWESEVYFKAGS